MVTIELSEAEAIMLQELTSDVQCSWSWQNRIAENLRKKALEAYHKPVMTQETYQKKLEFAEEFCNDSAEALLMKRERASKLKFFNDIKEEVVITGIQRKKIDWKEAMQRLQEAPCGRLTPKSTADICEELKAKCLVNNAMYKFIVKTAVCDPAFVLAAIGLHHPASEVVLKYLADKEYKEKHDRYFGGEFKSYFWLTIFTHIKSNMHHTHEM